MSKYTPPRVQTGHERGPMGLARVRCKKNKVQVIFKDGDTYVLNKDKCPESVRPGKWIVSLSADTSRMYGIRPIKGQFVGKVRGFPAPEGESPTPKEHPKWNYLHFNVLIAILEPEMFMNMLVPYNLRYHFDEAEIEGKSIVAYNHLKSKYTPVLEEFLEITGAWERGPIKWKSNILPTLEKRILREDRKFNFLLKDGWIDTIWSFDIPNEEPLWDEDEEETSKQKVVDTTQEDDNNEIQWEDE